MRSSSLPFLHTQSKLFSSEQDLQASRSEFRSRLLSEVGRSPSEERKPTRALIHFQENLQGFTSFRSINSSRIEEILHSLKDMRSGSSNLGKVVKAEILFNKNQYARITEYCKERQASQREAAINRLAKLEPLPMKKEVKNFDPKEPVFSDR